MGRYSSLAHRQAYVMYTILGRLFLYVNQLNVNAIHYNEYSWLSGYPIQILHFYMLSVYRKEFSLYIMFLIARLHEKLTPLYSMLKTSPHQSKYTGF